MLYVFAGFPKSGSDAGSFVLHAGGIRHGFCACQQCFEDRGEPPEADASFILEHDPNIQYRKQGVFISGTDEFLYPVEYRMSDLCLSEGITWDWFRDTWRFGNGVTIHKTWADPEYKNVIHGTDLSLDEYLIQNGPTSLNELQLERVHVKTEGWEQYESRYPEGMCPQESHIVHLTWMVTTHRLPEFAYERIRNVIEYSAEPRSPERYSSEPGHHFSQLEIYDGTPVVQKG